MVVSVAGPPASNIVVNNQTPTLSVAGATNNPQTGYLGELDGPAVPGTNPYLYSTTNLSLEDGMTAGYGNNDGITSNPPLLNTVAGGQWDAYGGFQVRGVSMAPQRIGLMRTLPGALPGNLVYTLYFIYNPGEIDVSFYANTAQFPANYLYGGNAASSASSNDPTTVSGSANYQQAIAAAATQTVNFSLFFDRTYDMVYGEDPGNSKGVLKDTAALYNIMGTFESQGAIPISVPLQCLFGATDAGDMWGITGFISAFSIEYGIFRANMIPSKCMVDITMTTAYVSSQLPGSSSVANTVPTGPALGVPGALPLLPIGSTS